MADTKGQYRLPSEHASSAEEADEVGHFEQAEGEVQAASTNSQK